jgi:hypothetical protein
MNAFKKLEEVLAGIMAVPLLLIGGNLVLSSGGQLLDIAVHGLAVIPAERASRA